VDRGGGGGAARDRRAEGVDAGLVAERWKRTGRPADGSPTGRCARCTGRLRPRSEQYRAAAVGWRLPPLVRRPARLRFFREDRKDAADIQYVKSQTIRNFTDAGFEPDTAVAAVETEDPTKLVHTNLYSVQLQAPLTGKPDAPAA